jgi:hypothetical protein
MSAKTAAERDADRKKREGRNRKAGINPSGTGPLFAAGLSVSTSNEIQYCYQITKVYAGQGLRNLNGPVLLELCE